jgi:hypothetical protein
MARIEILPVRAPDGEVTYHALAGDMRSQGRTAGEALDALRSQLSGAESTTLVIVQGFAPDRFFDAGQQERLAELMARWRRARDSGEDSGEDLPAEEQLELDDLIEEEVRASARRTAALLQDLGR